MSQPTGRPVTYINTDGERRTIEWMQAGEAPERFIIDHRQYIRDDLPPPRKEQLLRFTVAVETATPFTEVDAGKLHGLVQSAFQDPRPSRPTPARQDTEESTSASNVMLIELQREQITVLEFVAFLSALTNFLTRCWLIQSGRFADLIDYVTTGDQAIVPELNPSIIKVSYNSPLSMLSTLSPSGIGEAVAKAIGGLIKPTAEALQILFDTVYLREARRARAEAEAMDLRSHAIIQMEGLLRSLVPETCDEAEAMTRQILLQGLLRTAEAGGPLGAKISTSESS